MAGRLVDSDRVKEGEIVPIGYLALVDANKPRETAAAIQAVYLDRRQQAGEVAEFRDMTMGEPEQKRGESGFTEAERRILAELGVEEPDDPVYMRPDMRAHLQEEIRLAVESRPGMSKQYSKYLFKLADKLSEKSEQKLEISDVPRRMSQRERGVKASQMAIEHKYPAEPKEKLRKEILANSLFPSIYNRKNLMRAM